MQLLSTPTVFAQDGATASAVNGGPAGTAFHGLPSPGEPRFIILIISFHLTSGFVVYASNGLYSPVQAAGIVIDRRD